MFHPSCSEYAKLALAEHGIFTGSLMAIDRYLRCNGTNRELYPYDPVRRKLLDPVPNAAAELDQAFPEEEIVEPWRRAELERLKRLLAEARSSQRKSPNAALLLSTIVPGTGQLYAGDPWDALNAFALNAGLGTIIFTAMKNEYYLEAALLFLYPFRRYYLGNRDNARIAAEKSNRAADQQFRERIMDQILSLQESEQRAGKQLSNPRPRRAEDRVYTIHFLMKLSK